MVQIDIQPDAASLMHATAERLTALAGEAISARGRFSLVLSGGSTPKALYALLTAEPYVTQIDWARVQVFFGDERCVPPSDERSNYRMARETLLDRVPLPATNVHRMRGEDPPAAAAAAYERDIRSYFAGCTDEAGTAPAWPRFDFVLLGMGDNGHTASLFPGTAALREQTRWVVAQYVEVVQMWRITLTVPAINAAANVAFLVAGAAKADMLQRLVDGPRDPDVLPAQMIHPHDGRLTWLVDEPAATKLRKRG